ncbi:hypothetical protein OXIME_001106 [Oxyplasma meridianum]|uniref:Uncharacterized protein n=1 Tax=Oxyplasma meridianum TaxID=3073602 RepID=A0AAX4NHE8_9ARCH
MAEASFSKEGTIGFLLIVDFIITIVILLTDKNLQTDFGIVKPYFIHWYGMLVTGIIDIMGAGIIIAKPTKVYLKAGTVGSALLAVFLIADLATYKMVGLSSVSQFATYLFGFSHYPGALSYIPGLYDILFIFYIITAITGVIILKGPS